MLKFPATCTTTASLALVALVVQNTALVILMKLSFRAGAEPYDPTTVVLTVEFVKLIVCSLVVLRRSAAQLIETFVRIPDQKLLLFPSLLYVVQNNLLFFGARRLSPIAYIVCSQMKILTTAMISRIILGTTLSVVQSLALVVLVFGVVIVQGQGQKLPSSTTNLDAAGGIGAAAVLLASFTSGLAGVLLEKIYKGRDGSNTAAATELLVWTRNVQLGCVSLPFAFLGTLFQREGWKFFRGFDVVVTCVVLLQAFGGVLTGYVLIYANNILKCLAIAMSICCCAVFSVMRGDQDLTALLVLGVIVVNVAVSVFSLNPQTTARPKNVNERKLDAEATV